ncbi:MAG TPA: exonuclease SbcCD subunit D C-terminal domain-containing protein [Kofleriaceae bacterium]|nr:exonuclease SbcCD subunit D C-terminal domain-containing protein [Kofleriaceae bacterium]
MRLLHTSDWHLGHTLKEVARDYEHQAFLAWLLETCVRETPDVLVITGDIFDSATPPASAERMWFELLAAARRARPAMDIIAIAGNHDSPARLGAAAAVLRELGVHVIGSLPRRGDGSIDMDRVLISVAGGRGLVAAVPFLRPIDLPSLSQRPGDANPGDVPPAIADPMAAIYGEVIAEARRRQSPEQALVALGHLYAAGAEPSASERRVSVGGQESASLRMFPREIDYVALGHIHRSQRIGRETIRYAGAPIALSIDEAHYRHQVVVVDFDGAKPAGDRAAIRSIEIPQVIEIVRVPKRGAAPLDEILAALDQLPPRSDGDDPACPYLEVEVLLERPEPRLRAMIESAIERKRVRLVSIQTKRTGDGAALGDRKIVARLAELDPRDVFAQLWAREHVEPPTAEVAGAFERLLAEVAGDADDPESERQAS